MRVTGHKDYNGIMVLKVGVIRAQSGRSVRICSSRRHRIRLHPGVSRLRSGRDENGLGVVRIRPQRSCLYIYTRIHAFRVLKALIAYVSKRRPPLSRLPDVFLKRTVSDLRFRSFSKQNRVKSIFREINASSSSASRLSEHSEAFLVDNRSKSHKMEKTADSPPPELRSIVVCRVCRSGA